VAGPQGLGATADALELATVGKRDDIAPDRRFRGIEQIGQLREAHDRALLHPL
jgi:hypothetical protein